MYQGHLPDGSSVQRHSAGGLYPYVIAVRERAGLLTYELLHPNGTVETFLDYQAAGERGLALKSGAGDLTETLRAMMLELYPLIATGATTLVELAQVVANQRDRIQGLPTSARLQSRYDVLRGMANLLKQFDSRRRALPDERVLA